MIDLLRVLRIHEFSIIGYGGSAGIRDEGSLLSVLARPYATFDQQDLYPTPVEKAAAIFYNYQASLWTEISVQYIFS